MKLSRLGFFYILVILILSLGGCTMVGPNFEPLETQLPETWDKDDQEIFKKTVSEKENIEWWKLFDDPVLNVLIKKAYEQNLSLRTAGLRILEARARLGLVKGNIYPQTQQMTGNLTTIGTTGPASDRNYNAASIGFDAAWEMDFWGKFRRAIESADASLLADIASYDDVLVTLTAEVARTYINIRTFEERIHLAKANGKIQEKALTLVI